MLLFEFPTGEVARRVVRPELNADAVRGGRANSVSEIRVDGKLRECTMAGWDVGYYHLGHRNSTKYPEISSSGNMQSTSNSTKNETRNTVPDEVFKRRITHGQL